jgi:hypothetical protein
MESIKLIFLLLFSILIGFGLWYLVFWFLSNEPNLFLWHWVSKMFYLILGVSSTNGVFENTTKNS